MDRIALLLLILLSLVTTAAAAPGQLDVSFGGAGLTAAPTVTEATALALQPDGALVAAGDAVAVTGTHAFALARFDADGKPDQSFGLHGTAITAVGPSDSIARALAIAPDGALIVAGYAFNGTNDEFAIARYTANGAPDARFGGGVIAAPLGAGTSQAFALALMPDGRIVVGGYAQSANGDLDFALLRLLPTGAPDSTFGTGGVVTTAVGGGDDVVRALVVQPDGKLVAGGYTDNGSDYDFALVRYNSDGSLDTTFAADGKLTVAVGSTQDYATALLLQPDGKLVAGGASQRGGGYRFALVRCDPDGRLDDGFGNGGTVTTAIGGSNDFVLALADQPDGALLAAGYTVASGVNTAVVARYTAAGALDAFGADGSVRTPFAQGGSVINAVSLQPDGKLAVAGAAGPAGATELFVARYLVADAPWTLSPRPFAFGRIVSVDQGDLETSNLITVSGLDSGVAVPVTVSGGEYQKNGAASYTSQPGWARNGDQFKVRHNAKTGTGEVTTTVLTVGGLQPANNPGMLLGSPVTGSFQSETDTSAGAWGPLSLAVLLAPLAWRRRAWFSAGCNQARRPAATRYRV